MRAPCSHVTARTAAWHCWRWPRAACASRSGRCWCSPAAHSASASQPGGRAAGRATVTGLAAGAVVAGALGWAGQALDLITVPLLATAVFAGTVWGVHSPKG